MNQAGVIIWDLDGTILDSLGVFEAVLGEILPKYDLLLPTHAEMLANFHGTLDESIDSVLGRPEPSVLASIVKDFLANQDSHYEIIEPHIFKDALHAMERAHAAGKRQILVTNRSHEGRLRASPRSIVANSDLSKYIDTVICGDDNEHNKPNPAVLGDLLDELHDKSILVIGDQHVDAQFALSLHSKGVLVARDGRPAHLDALPAGWENQVQIVESLDTVEL
jgi:phosphoglycolate phosphatase-like HAD superfamily hydrolase